jgi:hypothetical protein
MKRSQSSPSQEPPGNGSLDRNRLEIIRFASREDCSRGIAVLLDRGLLNFSSSAPNEWAVRTDVVRALREAGVPFEWVTEHA